MTFAKYLALGATAACLFAAIPASAQTNRPTRAEILAERAAPYPIRQCDPVDFFSRLFGLDRGDCVAPGSSSSPSAPTHVVQITGLNGI